MFKKIKITTSITILIFAFVLMHIISSLISVYRSSINDVNFSKTVTLNHQIDSLAILKFSLVQTRLDTYRAAASLIENDEKKFNYELNKAINNLKTVEKEMSYFLQINNPLPENQVLIDNLKTSYEQLINDLNYQKKQLIKEGFQGFRLVDINESQDTFLSNTDKIINSISQVLKGYDNLSERVHYYSFLQFIAESTLLLAMLAIAIKWNSVILKKPLNELIEHFNAIANGDLTKNVSIEGNNEIAQLFNYFEKMQKYLINTVEVVRNSSDILVKGVSDVVLKNKNLSVRTEQQSSAIQVTATNMDQLTQVVKLNADNAIQASKIADFSAKNALKGDETNQTVTNTMESISESARKITSILSLIDGISFQTNILALNAAVEAARAGEQGRGFAVVASEVRNLALRSAEAAKEINLLIEESNIRVKTGTGLVNQAGSTIKEIVNSANQVNELMNQISIASKQQSTGISQVTQSIYEMDITTQENANLVNELTNSAGILEAQAAKLIDAVSLFKI